MSLLGGNAVLRYAGSGAAASNRQINFLDMGGAIEVSEATGALTLGGTLTGSGVFNKLGNGRLALTGSNAYTGNTIVTAGVLNVSNAGALGATTAAIDGSSGVSGGGVYVQAAAALEVQGGIALGGAGGKTAYLNGNGSGNGGALRSMSGTNSNAGAVILQTDSTIGVDAGRLSLSGPVEGARLTKVGAGDLVLTGSNGYTGGTVIAAGTLIANNAAGSATGSGDVSLAAGAALGGAGRIGGTVTTGGIAAVISPGDSTGTLTLGGLDASAGATFNFDLGSTSDLMDLGLGAFTGSSFDGGLVLNLSNAGGLAAGTYTLISFGSSSGLDYSDFAVNLSLGGFSLDSGFGNNGFLITDHAFQVQIAPVPEANTLIFVLSGMGGLTLLRRRSRKAAAGI